MPSALTVYAPLVVNDPLSPLMRRRSAAWLFLDFDGTLSEIVDRPDEAQPVNGAVDLLDELTRLYKTVAVVSGRSARELAERFGPRIDIWGLHGAEHATAGRVELAASARPYEALMNELASEVRDRLEGTGVLVEPKGVMVGLHYRTADDRRGAEAAARRVAEEMTSRHGIKVGSGRFVVELRPPVDFSKGSVVRERARVASLEAVAFAGDDVVDLPAFDALDELAREGLACVRIAVASDETPEELLSRADVIVQDGPRGMVDLLRRLTS